MQEISGASFYFLLVLAAEVFSDKFTAAALSACRAGTGQEVEADWEKILSAERDMFFKSHSITSITGLRCLFSACLKQSCWNMNPAAGRPASSCTVSPEILKMAFSASLTHTAENHKCLFWSVYVWEWTTYSLWILSFCFCSSLKLVKLKEIMYKEVEGCVATSRKRP